MQVKRLIAMVLAVALSLSLAACGSSQKAAEPAADTETQAEASQTESSEADDSVVTPEADQNETENGKNNILILYFSANNTKDVDAVSSATPMADGVSSVEWVAGIIHDRVGGDLVPIIPSDDYPLEYDDLADYAKEEEDNEGRPAFEDLGVDPASYETVFIGYPIWWYTTPKIMETFFETYDLGGITIIPFNTHAGSRDGGTYSLIKDREPEATLLDGLAVRGEDIGKDNARNSVEEWLDGLNLE